MSKLRFKVPLTAVDTPSEGVTIYSDSSFNILSKDENGNVTQLGVVSAFGANYEYRESLAQFDTTSNVFQTAADFTINSLPAGNYRICFYAELQNVTGNNSGFWEYVYDPAGTPQVLGEVVKEPKDNTDWIPWSMFHQLSLSGNETFRFQCRSESSGSRTSMRNMKFELWRVS